MQVMHGQLEITKALKRNCFELFSDCHQELFLLVIQNSDVQARRQGTRRCLHIVSYEA